MSDEDLKYITVPPRATYYGTEFLDYSSFSIGGDQSVRVGKSANPIMVDDKIVGVMIWEEPIDRKFANRIIPQSFETHEFPFIQFRLP